MTLTIGDEAPDFTLPTDSGNSVTLSSLRGKKVVLYFYPKDDTPGCTTQACNFRDSISNIRSNNASVLGISKDDVQSHKKFKEKYGLNFPLLSDESGQVCEEYGVWAEKSMYGRTYMGIERTTFLIDENGVIARIWNKVSVPGHVDEIEAELMGKAANNNTAPKSKKAAPKAKAAKTKTAKKKSPAKKTVKKPAKKAKKKTAKPSAKKTSARKTARKSTKRPAKPLKKSARRTGKTKRRA